MVPTHNEAHVLEASIHTLRAFLREHCPYAWHLTIADNGSLDGTDEVARRLAARHADVGCLVLRESGRGRALAAAWLRSDADVLAYTDVDISTDLAALPRLLRAVAEDGADVAIGSRRLPGSDVTRSPGREILSRAYNALVRAVFWTPFRDAQCGLKAVSRRVVEELVPRVAEQRWLFDTELLVRAERRGWPVAEIPVRWVHDPDSRVRVLPAAWEVVRGVLRLRLALWREPIEGARRRVRRAGA